MDLLIDWVKDQNIEGLSLKVIKEKKKTPLLFMEINATMEDAPTCLLCNKKIILDGHCDKSNYY
jgi:hypothetical protein